MSMMDSHVETVEELLRGIEGEHKEDKTRVENDLSEVDESISQMKIEIHSVAGKAAKDGYNAKIKEFQTRVATAKKGLLFSGAASASAGSLAARQQTNEQKENQNLEILKKARQQLAETEEVGVATVTTLHDQTNQMKKIKGNTTEVVDSLNHSNKLLNKMSQWWRG